MAGETLYAQAITLAAAVESKISPWFSGNAFMPKLVAGFNVGVSNTNAKKLPISGSLTAAVVAENAAATAQTLTDTSVTLTLQKAVVLTNISVEALKFADGASTDRHAQLAAIACAKKFDTDVLALGSGISQVVDSTTTLTVAKAQEAAYTVRLGDVPVDTLAAVLSYKQAYQLAGDIRTNGGTFYGNSNFDPTVALQANKGSGFVGNLFGIDIFQSGNVLIDTAATPDDHVGLVFAPQHAFAALYPSGLVPSFEVEIDGSVGFVASTTYMKVTMWYQVAEYRDTAACRLISEI